MQKEGAGFEFRVQATGFAEPETRNSKLATLNQPSYG
jgi:hypothetical protein